MKDLNYLPTINVEEPIPVCKQIFFITIKIIVQQTIFLSTEQIFFITIKNNYAIGYILSTRQIFLMTIKNNYATVYTDKRCCIVR